MTTQIRKELSDLKAKQAEQDKHIARLEKLLDTHDASGLWKPKSQTDGFNVTGYGEIVAGQYGFDSYAYRELGNCFPTKEAAELHVKKLKVIQKLKELAGGVRPDWSDNTKAKWYICYDHTKSTNNWFPAATNYYRATFVLPCFPTQADVIDAITTLGDELNCLLEA